MNNCPSILKPQASGLNICSSEICFDANFSCLNIPLGANLNQALQVMEAALCWNGTLPSCVTVDVGASMQDVIEAIALKTCLEEDFYEVFSPQFLGDDPAWSSSTWFVPSVGGYSALIHTNTSAVSKTYIVGATVAFGKNGIAAGVYGDSDVDMAIFYRDINPTDIEKSVVNGGIQINFTYPGDPSNLTTTLYNIETSNSDMTELTLEAGESVLLKFRTKDASTGFIKQAKLHVKEKH
mgnify:CR=1 FL=1